VAVDVLLLWDFSPGRALADQVRRRFKSPVHFSPSSSAKEFFLVVSFLEASFPLSEDAVSVALECCLGGSAVGFRVVRLSDKRFRFSVASNKVGHFIYSLGERVWLDFHCSFSLFRGDGFAPCFLPLVNKSDNNVTPGWSSKPNSHQNHMKWVPKSSSLAVKVPLGVLDANAFDGSSSAELAKFGFKVPYPSQEINKTVHRDLPLPSPPDEDSKILERHFVVGSMQCSFWEGSLDQGHINSGLISRTFIGHNFRKPNYW
jgi:hypothetical protein